VLLDEIDSFFLADYRGKEDHLWMDNRSKSVTFFAAQRGKESCLWMEK